MQVCSTLLRSTSSYGCIASPQAFGAVPAEAHTSSIPERRGGGRIGHRRHRRFCTLAGIAGLPGCLSAGRDPTKARAGQATLRTQASERLIPGVGSTTTTTAPRRWEGGFSEDAKTVKPIAGLARFRQGSDARSPSVGKSHQQAQLASRSAQATVDYVRELVGHRGFRRYGYGYQQTGLAGCLLLVCTWKLRTAQHPSLCYRPRNA